MKKLITLLIAVCTVFLSACGNQEIPREELYTLKWVFPAREQMEDSAEIYRRVNEIIQQSYPEIYVEFEGINLNEYESRLEMYKASKEKMDIIWGNDLTSPYYEIVYFNNSHLILNEPLKKYGKELISIFESMPKNVLDDIRYNGDLYYLPNAPGGTGLIPYLKIPYEYRDYFDISSLDIILNDGKVGGKPLYNLIDTYLSKVKALDNTRNKIDYYSLIEILPRVGYKSIISTYELLGYNMNEDNGNEIFSLKNTEEYMNFLDYTRKWQNEGLIAEDIEILHNNHTLYGGNYLLDAGWGYFENGHFYSASNDIYIDPAEYYYIPLGNIVYTSNTVSQGMTYIHLDTEYKEQAIKVLTLFYSNPELYHLLTYGIAEEDYKVEDNLIKRNNYLTYGNVFPHYNDKYYDIPDDNVASFSVENVQCLLDDVHPISAEAFYWLDVYREEIINSERNMEVSQKFSDSLISFGEKYIGKW